MRISVMGEDSMSVDEREGKPVDVDSKVNQWMWIER
jgi:hypothetical protein